MTLQDFGSDIRLSYLRSRFPVSAEYGLSLFDLKRICAEFGLDARGIRFDLDDIKNVTLPCILHWGNNHFVVLEGVGRRQLKIIDPASGRRTVSFRHARSKVSGYALEFVDARRDVHITTEAQQHLDPGSLKKYLPRYNSQIAFTCFVGLTIELIAIITPVYVQLSIDEVTSSLNFDFILALAIVFLLVHLFEGFFKFLRQTLSIAAERSMTLRITDSLTSRLLQLPQIYFQNRNTGDLIARLGSVAEVSAHLTLDRIQIWISAIAAVATLILMAVIDVEMAVLSFAVLTLITVLRIITFRPMLSALNQQLTSKGRADGILVESLESIHSIRYGGFTDTRLALWQKEFADSIRHGQKGDLLRAFFDSVSGILINLERIIIVCFACFLVLQGELTVGILYAYIQYKALFSGHVLNIADFRMKRSLLRSHLERIEDIALEEVPLSRTDRLSQADLEPLESPFSVAVKGLTWAPVLARDDLLKDINLEAAPGATCVIRGRSGSGKSSFLSLLYGRTRPMPGQIFFDDIDIVRMSQPDLVTLVATVTPEDRLLAGTVIQNIAGDITDINFVRVVEAATQAGIHDRIMAFANGYNTQVQHHSPFLSSGERQRLLLARALYKPSPLLILDEFASSLDEATARAIWQAVFEIEDRTIIIATHKPELLEGHGTHYEMDQGMLTPIGSGR